MTGTRTTEFRSNLVRAIARAGRDLNLTSEALMLAAEAVPDSSAEIAERTRTAAMFAGVTVDKAFDIAEQPALNDEALVDALNSAAGVLEAAARVLGEARDAIPRTATRALFMARVAALETKRAEMLARVAAWGAAAANARAAAEAAGVTDIREFPRD